MLSLKSLHFNKDQRNKIHKLYGILKGDNCYEKQQEMEDHKYRGGIIILNRRVRVGLAYEVTLEQIHEETEG